MNMPILKVVELLEKQSEATEGICGRQFVQACMTAARYLVQQGEKIVDLEQELAVALFSLALPILRLRLSTNL